MQLGKLHNEGFASHPLTLLILRASRGQLNATIHSGGQRTLSALYIGERLLSATSGRSQTLLNHLIRPRQYRLRDRQAERLGGLEIDHQLEFRGLLHRQVGRLGALDYPVHIRCGAQPTVPATVGDTILTR